MDEKRFWSNVDKKGPNDCWEWKGYVGLNGYGRISNLYAHRIAHSLATGWDVGSSEWILHNCDNPICCNPAHLRAGTPQDNVDDRERRKMRPAWMGGIDRDGIPLNTWERRARERLRRAAEG